MDIEHSLDPELAAVFATLPVFSFDWGAVKLADIPAAREQFAPVGEPPEMQSLIEDLDVDGLDGDPVVGVRIYSPYDAPENLPCLYWIHGGGYMVGSARNPDLRLDRWAVELECVIVSVEYRLAPETPFPGPLNDAYAGLLWTARNPARLGIDPNRIVIGGGSAGAGLCAALALMVRDRAEVPVTFQFLIYPMLDDRMVTPSSTMETVGWTPPANRLGWRAYLGQEPGSDGVSPYAAAARAEDLSGLPDAFICVGTLDILRDEDIDYARRLLAAGVETELHVYPGAPHSFDSLAPNSDVGSRSISDIDHALSRALDRSYTPR